MVKKHNIKYLIDLHEMSSKRDVLFSLGTCFSKNADHTFELTHQFIKIAQKNLDAEKIRIDFPFASSSKKRDSTAINLRNKIETLQVEINSKLFQNDESVLKVIETFDEFVSIVSKIKTMPGFDRNDITEVRNLEKVFTDDKEGEKILLVERRNGEILLTSPHSQSMIKEGKICYRETFSGGLCLALSRKYNLSNVCKCLKTDFDSSQQYIENVVNLVREEKSKIVIELHIMNKNRYEDISLITNQGFSIGGNFQIMSSILKILTANGFSKIGLDYPFNAFNTSSTVSLIHKQTGALALQFIVNQKVFKSSQKLKRLVWALGDIIRKINCTI